MYEKDFIGIIFNIDSLVVGKNSKVKNCYVVIVYSTNENYTNNLERKANELLSEAESNLR